MRKIMFRMLLPLVAVLLPAAGCAGWGGAANNAFKPTDFADYLQREGIKVESVRDMPPEPFRATSGCAIKVAGSEIGVYKYDQTSAVQRKRLNRIARDTRTYINGIPYPVAVQGSFMVFGLDKNPQKREILRVLKKFK